MSQHDSDLGDLIADRTREREWRDYKQRIIDLGPDFFDEDEDHEPPAYVDPLLPVATRGLVQGEQGSHDGRCFGRDDDPGCWRDAEQSGRWPA